jgi:hypothetical protein
MFVAAQRLGVGAGQQTLPAWFRAAAGNRLPHQSPSLRCASSAFAKISAKRRTEHVDARANVPGVLKLP